MLGDPMTRTELDRLRAGAGTNADVRRLVDDFRRLDAFNRALESRLSLLRGDVAAELESAHDDIADKAERIAQLEAERSGLRKQLEGGAS